MKPFFKKQHQEEEEEESQRWSLCFPFSLKM
jgi:hypothetical protein